MNAPVGLPNIGLSGPAEQRAQLSTPLPTQQARDTWPPRLFSALETRVDDDGEVLGRSRSAITSTWWEVSAAHVVRRWIVEHKLPGPADPEPTDEDVRFVRDELIAMVRQAHAATERTVPTQPVEAAVAGRVARARRVWADKDGALRWADRPADPVTAPGAAPEPPAPVPSGLLDRVFRREPRDDGEPITAAGLEAWAAMHRGIVQPYERPSWPDVLDELRALVA